MFSIRVLLFLVILANTLFSEQIRSQYSIKSLDFNASDVYPQIKDDFILYRFDKNQYHKAFSSDNLAGRFKEHGVMLSNEIPSIIHVQRKSDVKLDRLREEIRSYYYEHYPTVSIKGVSVKSNTFLSKLPDEYQLTFKPNAYLYRRSSLQLTSKDKKERYFFTYTLNATIKLFKARHNINRGKILTRLDLIYKEIEFKRLKGLPVKDFDKNQYRLKKRLPKDKTLYAHDIEELPYVLKDKPLNVRLISGKVHLEFQAVSLEDGNKGAHVLIQKTDGKKLKARVIGRNLVEIE